MAAVSFDSTLGAIFIGFAVAAVLYGILLIQAYAYFQRYALDRPLYKILVVLVLILETFHSALSGHTVYYYTISSFTNPFALLVPTWTILAQVLVGACISVVVKVAFAMRVWRFSDKNMYLTGCILLLSAGVLGLAVTLTAKAFQLNSFAEASKVSWLTNTVLAMSASTDIIIAVSLTYYLHHLRNTFSANTLINGLITYSLETGAVTSICGIGTLVSFDVLPDTFAYWSFYFVLSKLYSNSLLATLNTRRVVRGRGTDRAPGTTGEFTIIRSADQIRSTHSIFGQVDWSKQPTDIEVNVMQEVVSTSSDPDQYRAKSVEKSTVTDYQFRRMGPQQRIHGRSVEYADVQAPQRLRAPERVARF